MRLGARAAGLALGFAADQMLGDPRRGHPVAASWAAARLDDLANLVPSRAAALLTTVTARFAGALAVRLGGSNTVARARRG
jgi:adenosylcobinamide-phosphate synthase